MPRLDVGHVGRAHLHVTCQHRVGGCQDRAQQHCGRPPEPESPPAEQPHGPDGHRHRDQQQPPGRRPAKPVVRTAQPQRPVQGQPHAHQRQQYGELGDLLDDSPVLDGIEDLVATHWQKPDRQARSEQDDGRGDRALAEHRWEHGGEEDGDAGDEVQGVGHERILRVPQ
jgi:hypothetical protein